MRVQGGTRGLLSAIAAGRIDPLSAWLPEDRHVGNLSPTNLAKIKRRERRLAHERSRRLARLAPF